MWFSVDQSAPLSNGDHPTTPEVLDCQQFAVSAISIVSNLYFVHVNTVCFCYTGDRYVTTRNWNLKLHVMRRRSLLYHGFLNRWESQGSVGCVTVFAYILRYAVSHYAMCAFSKVTHRDVILPMPVQFAHLLSTFQQFTYCWRCRPAPRPTATLKRSADILPDCSLKPCMDWHLKFWIWTCRSPTAVLWVCNAMQVHFL